MAKDLDEMLSRIEQQEKAIAAKNQEIEECKTAVERLQKINESLQNTIEKLTTRLEICESNIDHDKEKKEALLTKTEFQRVTYVWLVPVDDLKHKEQFSSTFYVGSESLCFQLGITNVYGKLSVGLYRYRAAGNSSYAYIARPLNFVFRIFILGPNGVEQYYVSCNSNSGYFSIGDYYERSMPVCLPIFDVEDPQFRNLFYNGRLQIHCEVKPLIEL